MCKCTPEVKTPFCGEGDCQCPSEAKTMKEPRYKIGDTVWVLLHDMGVKTTVLGMAVFTEGTRYWLSNEPCENNGAILYWWKENKVFPTKEALIASL